MPNVCWLEDFPLLEPLFEQEPRYEHGGSMRLPAAPGLGLAGPGAREGLQGGGLTKRGGCGNALNEVSRCT